MSLDDVEFRRYGLRTFKVDPDHMRLGSMAISGSHWKGGTCVAKCLKNDPLLQGYKFKGNPPKVHTSPHLECSCGIYGSLYLDNLINQYSGYTQQLIAVIAAEGTTVIGSKGFRTEAARIVAYFTQYILIENTMKRVAPEAVSFGSLKKMLTQYGCPMDSPEPPEGGPVGIPGGPDWWRDNEVMWRPGE
jgi:hypothetical protein